MRSALLAAGCAAALGVGGVLAAYTSAGAAPSVMAESAAAGSAASNGSEHAAHGHDEDAKGEPHSAHAEQMVQIAHTHRDAMHQWQKCTRAAAKPGANRPASACEKPLPPGWLKHPDQHQGERPGSRGHDGHPETGSADQD